MTQDQLHATSTPTVAVAVPLQSSSSEAEGAGGPRVRTAQASFDAGQPTAMPVEDANGKADDTKSVT